MAVTRSLVVRIAVWTGLALALVVLLAAGLRLAAGHAPGRWFAASQLNGRDISGLGRISVTGLSGDPLANLRIARLTLSDDEGVWLTADGVQLDWHANSLFARPIRIDAALTDRITIDRMPVLADQAPPPARTSAPGLPQLPALDLGRLAVARLELAEGVAGPPAVLSLTAEANLRAATSRASLDAERLDAPGDQLSVELALVPDGITGRVSAVGAPDGTLAALLHMPGRSVRLDGNIQGAPNAGSGHFTLTGNNAGWATAEIEWDASGWRGLANVQVGRWGVMPDALASEVAEVRASATGTWNAGFPVDEATLESAAGRIVVREFSGTAATAEFDISPTPLARLSGDRVSADRLTGRASLSRAGGLSIRVEPEISGLTAPGLSVQRVSGSLDISLPEGRPRLAFDLNLERPSTGTSEIDRLTGDSVRLTGIAIDGGETWGWRVEPGFRLQGEAFELLADARLPPGADWPVGSVAVKLLDLAPLHSDLSGQASVDVEISNDRTLRFAINASETNWPVDARGLLDDLVASARITPTDSGWNITEFSARSPALDMTLSGHISDASNWQIGGDLALSGTQPIAMAELDGGLTTAFRLVRDEPALHVQAVTSTRELQAGPIRLTRPRLGVRGQLTGSDELYPITLEWIFTAAHDAGEVALNGAVRGAAGETEITIANGRVSDLDLAGAVQLVDDQLTVSLNAQRDELITLTVAFAAALDNMLAGTLDAELSVNPQRLGAADINAASLALSGPLTELALTAHAEGQMRSNFDVSATGDIALSENGVTVSISPSGKWAAHNWTTEAPIRVATAPDGLVASAAFTLGGGRLDLDFRTTGASPIASLAIDALPVSVLADIAAIPATQGTLSGNADFRESQGAWRGTALLDATGLLAGDQPDMPELDLQVTAALQDDARGTLRLTGGGLDVRGNVRRDGLTWDIARPQGDPEASLSGAIEASGELMALAALLLPSDVLLETGHIDSQLEISGSVGSPQVDGTMSIREGRINATTAGSLVTDLELDLTLSEDRLGLTRLSAADNREGRMSGQGHIERDEAGDRTGQARFEFERFVAVLRPELTLQASGNTVLTLDQDGLLVGGSARIDQLRTQPTLNGAASIPQLQVTEINLPEDRRALNEARLPVRLDYRVQADNGLYVSSPAFTSEWGVDLHVSGPEAKPSLVGSATLLGGSAFVFNRRFNLAAGTVTFDGAADDARVNLTAVHTRTSFRATARVEGSVHAPTVTLSSDPALPEDEIIARLLFDQSVSELGAFEAAQLAAQLSGQNLLDVVGQLRDLAGIDRLDISTGENGELAVVGGRRFGDNVYVEIGSAGAAAINEALIEWSLTPDLSVLSRVSADTDASVAIRWRRDY